MNVAVSDTGVGMDDETRARIFETILPPRRKGREPA
jgi:nitrogen fixation/metabolism regulation signal transduction histidine kinase